jgi:hypothetical protein
MRLTKIMVLMVASAAPAQAQQEAKLVDQVRVSIERGIRFLRDQEKGRGNWEVDAESAARKGGWTSLAMLALLQSGVPPQDEMIQRGLKYLRGLPPEQTYTVGLQTMVYCLAGQPEDAGRVKANVAWLERAMVRHPNLVGWSYVADGAIPDNSNTQYALLGLHEALLAGHQVSPDKLRAVRQFFLQSQQRDGGWTYRGGGFTTMTMTTAGLCNLLICGMDLQTGKAVLQADGSALNCGLYDEIRPVRQALDWIGTNFPGRMNREATRRLHHVFYALYGIERAGRLTGQRFFGGHDWYRVGSRYLVEQQKQDGSWGYQAGEAAFGLDNWPVVATSLSLLFLSKGRTPVLVSKLAHNVGDGWNNKRSDMRNLTDFCSREVFKGMPLAWQIFDVRQAAAEDAESVRALADELLGSPIVFFNHHTRVPGGREKELLKEYLANGGFVVAEACCGRGEFDAEFRALVKDLFPDNEMFRLPPGHPLWTATGKFVVPDDEFPVYGVSQGCKIVLLYLPKPIAGYWEAKDDKSKRGEIAFKLGASIVAYATGLEPPRPRLTEVEVARGGDKIPVRRGFLRAAQIRHEGDWQPAPKAVRHLMLEARKLGLDVVPEPATLPPDAEQILDFRFFYMHGRQAFSFPPARLDRLRFSLENGGILLADACCGSKAFDASFRAFVNDLFKNSELPPGAPRPKLEPVPLDDELYGAELNGTRITEVRKRRELPGGKPSPGFEPGPPRLEGVKWQGRWVVLYSPIDLGCALERAKSPDCLGHDFEGAATLGKAVINYSLRR